MKGQRHTNGHRAAQHLLRARYGHSLLCNGQAHALGQVQYALFIRVQADNDELLSPVRQAKSVRRTVRRSTCATWHNTHVANLVAMGVVDALAVVNIEQQQARRPSSARAEMQLKPVNRPRRLSKWVSGSCAAAARSSSVERHSTSQTMAG